MHLIQMERMLLIAQVGNITEAAQKLYISQPSLSQMISSVEQELGATIFDRRTKPLKLTSEGECFIQKARQILNAHKTMIEEIHSIQTGTTGKINFGASIPRCRTILPHILPEMVAHYPDITLNFIDGKSQEFEQKILLGSMDLAFSNIPPVRQEIGCHKLNPERYYLVANRKSSFAQRLDNIRFKAGKPEMPFSLREAARQRFVLLNPQRNSRIAFNQMSRDASIKPHIAIETDNSDIALEYVAVNLGIAVYAIATSNNDAFLYQTDTFSFFAIDSKYASRDLFLYYDKTCQPSLSQQYFIDLILDSFAPRKETTLST
jgi:DNA-binding transcriptional LysR family regulator